MLFQNTDVLDAKSPGGVCVFAGSATVALKFFCAISMRTRWPLPSSVHTSVFVPLPACPTSAPDIAGTNTEVWADDGKGHLVRIDMAQKNFSATIALPANAPTPPGLFASSTSVFWNSTTGVYRAEADISSLVQISRPAFYVFPVGDGVWEDIDDQTVGFFDADPNTPTSTVDVLLEIIGADAANIYTEDPTNNDVLEYPINGGAGAGLGISNYVAEEGTGLIIGEHNAFRLFDTATEPDAPVALYMENYPLP